MLVPNRTSKSILIPTAVVVMLLVSFSALAQASHFFLFHKARYQATKTQAQVIGKLNKRDQLFITGQRLMPAFVALMLKSTDKEKSVHCVFCAGAGYLPATIWKKEASDYVYNDLAKQKPKNMVWGVMKQDVLYQNKEKREVCFMLKGFPAPVLLLNDKILYQDAGNIFYRAKKLWIGPLGESCKTFANLPVLPGI